MLQSAMQIYEKFFNDTTERIYFIVFLEKPYSLTEKHGKSSLVTRCHSNTVPGTVLFRKMEPAWEKVQGGKFSLLQKTYDLPNSGKKMMPYYSLTKTETLAYRMMTLRVLPSAVRMMFSPLRADDERWPLMEYHSAADASASTRLMPVGSMLKNSFHTSAAL